MIFKIFYRLTLLIFLSIASLSANADYTFTDLGEGVATAINASGQAVGWSPIGGQTHATLWNGTTASDLGALGSDMSWAYGINASGQVVGASYSFGNSNYNAILWDGATTSVLSTKGQAFSINDTGQVVGVSTNAIGYQAATLWDGTATIYLNKSAVPIYANATSINDSGQVTGGSNDTITTYNHATLWKNGTTNDLGTLGSGYSQATSINASGQVVGGSYTAGISSISGDFHATLWSDGTIKDLGTLGGNYSNAKSINSSGQIVGYYNTIVNNSMSYVTSHAVLWNGTTAVDLNSLLSPIDKAAGWVLSEANGINDSGSIVGFAYNNHTGFVDAFLLTSVAAVPETDTSAMLLMGVGVMGFVARRRKGVV